MTLRGIGEAALSAALIASLVTSEIERRAARREHLAGLNVAAAADSTHHKDVGDLQVARRQAQQLEIQLAAKTHESNERGVALANLSITVQELKRQTIGTATTSAAGLLTLSGALDAWDTAGVRIHATAAVPIVTNVAGDRVAKAAESAWTWDLERRPLSLTIDFACHRDTALVHVVGPTWARADIIQGTLAPEICNPPSRWNPLSFQVPSLPVAGALVVLGYVLHR